MTKNSEVHKELLANKLKWAAKETGLTLAINYHDTRPLMALFEVTFDVDSDKQRVESYDKRLSEWVSKGTMYDILDSLYEVFRTVRHNKEGVKA